MLNAKALTELLSKNSDERLCKRWFLMTLNGTLLAYTQPTNIRDLRKQAAMATLSWQEYQHVSKPNAPDGETESEKAPYAGSMHTLTMESEGSNVIIRRIQPQLLLVLEGGVPPRRPTFEPRVTPEGDDDALYPPRNSTTDPKLGSSVSSATESAKSKAATSVLVLQRKKLDALASAIAQDLEETGFKIPEPLTAKIF